jgi:hypothetical protein
MKSIVTTALFICVFHIAINAQYNCVIQSPFTIKRDLYFIVSNGNRYVAGGDDILLTSHNGWNWTSIDSNNINEGLRSAVWTGTQFVVIGDYGLVMTSTDGLNWKTYQDATINSAKSITWTGSKLVVVENKEGNGLFTSISSDGVNWTNYEDEDFPKKELQSVTWTGSRLYAAGDDGLITSVDGIKWTSVQTKVNGSFSSITWTGNKLIATCNDDRNGLVLTSQDGQEWTVDTIIKNNSLTSAASIGSQIVVGTAKSILISSDGKTWKEQNLYSNESIEYVNKIGNRCFAVGKNGTIYASEDGIAWSYRPVTTLFSVIWTGELFVAAGVNKVFTSPDGYAWTERFNLVYQIQSVAG